MTTFKVKLNGVEFKFQPDSGSDVSLCSRQHLRDLEFITKKPIKLKPVTRTFRAANNSQIVFDGYFIAELQTQSGKKLLTRMHVLDMPPNDPALIGEIELLKLGLMRYNPKGELIRSISNYPKPKINLDDPKFHKKFNNLHERFKKVFIGIGCLKNYQAILHLKDNAVEFYQKCVPVPLHLVDQTTERLEEYIQTGLFEHIPPNEPLTFCSRLLVIEEKNNKIRLVGDYREINKFIRRMQSTKYFLT